MDTEPEADGFSFGHGCAGGLNKYGHEYNKDVAANSKGRIDDWLYGFYNAGVWTEGALFKAFRKLTGLEKAGMKLLHIKVHHCDPEFVEPLNKLLDDNKSITLVNGETFNLAEHDDVKIVFEV